MSIYVLAADARGVTAQAGVTVISMPDPTAPAFVKAAFLIALEGLADERLVKAYLRTIGAVDERFVIAARDEIEAGTRLVDGFTIRERDLLYNVLSEAHEDGLWASADVDADDVLNRLRWTDLPGDGRQFDLLERVLDRWDRPS